MDRTGHISRGLQRTKSAPLLRDTCKDLDSEALSPESGGSPFVKTDPCCNAIGTVNPSGLHERQPLTSCAGTGGGVASTGNSCQPKDKQAPDDTPLQVMSDDLAGKKLHGLQGILQQALDPRPTRGGDSSTPVPSEASMQELAQKLATFSKECTPSKVFGCEPGGVLPPTRSDDANSKNGRLIDKAGTVAIRKSIRHQWEARYVDGDGNCLWRSAAYAFFGTDHHWRQLKLVSLAHAAAHVNELHKHVLRNHYDDEITAKYAHTEFFVLDDGARVQIPEMARTDLMLLASISKLCPFGEHAGSVACRLIAEALGITVKMLHKFDAKARKQQDKKRCKDGAERDGNAMDDARWSHTFAPRSTPSQCWRVQDDVFGQASYSFRDEIVVVMVMFSYPLNNPTPVTLQALPEVEHNATGAGAGCNHFAAIVNIDGPTNIPFPLYTCAPALYAGLDSNDKTAFTEEVRQRKERDSARSSKLCAASTAAAEAGKIMDGQEVEEIADAIRRRHSARAAASREKRRADLEKEKERLRAQHAAASKTNNNRHHEDGGEEATKGKKKEKTGKASKKAHAERAPARTGRGRRYPGWKGVAAGILGWGGVILFFMIMAERWIRVPSTNESHVVTDSLAAARHYYSMFEPANANKQATEAAAQPRRGSRRSRKKDRKAINDAANQLSSSKAAISSAGSSRSSSTGGEITGWSFFSRGDQASSTAVDVPDRSSSTGGNINGWNHFTIGQHTPPTAEGVKDSSSSTAGKRKGWRFFNMGGQTSSSAAGSSTTSSTSDEKHIWSLFKIGEQRYPTAVGVPDSSTGSTGKGKSCSFFNMGHKTPSNDVGVPSSSTTTSSDSDNDRGVIMTLGDQLVSAVARVASGSGWSGGGGGAGGDMRGGVDRNWSGRDHGEHGTRGAFGRTGAGDERGQNNRGSGRFEGLRRRWEQFGEDFVEAVDGPWV